MATEIKNCDLNNNEINDAYDQNANELEEGHYGNEEAFIEEKLSFQFPNFKASKSVDFEV